MFDQSQIPFYVENKFLENFSAKRSGNRYNIRCPICGDSNKKRSKMRGNLYYKTGSYHCFNCDFTASGLYLISRLLNIDLSEVKKDYLMFIRSSNNTPRKVIEEPKPKVIQKIEVPNYWLELPPKIVEYVENRKIYEAPFLPKNQKFYYNKGTHRLVIPWINYNKIEYYQERALSKKQTPKYIFPKELSKKIFGLEGVDENFPYIFCLEGALDSIWVLNGVAIGGVSVTSEQRETLSRYIDSEIVIMLDNQNVDNTAKDKLVRVINNDLKQKVFIWPKNIKCKDVNELVIRTKENLFTDKNFLKNNIFSGVKALVKLKYL